MNYLQQRARTRLVAKQMGLTDSLASKPAGIVVFAGDIEVRIEWAIWKLEEHQPEGVRHRSDGKKISDLIEMLKTAGQALPIAERPMPDAWCETARDAYELRNNLVHRSWVRVGSSITAHGTRRWL